MLFKLVGSALVAISGIIAAMAHRRYQWKRLATIDGFIALLLYIKGQIDCFARPRCEIFGTVPAEVFCACNCPHGAQTLDEMIEASRTYLDDESTRLLSSFASEFGSTFRDEQLRRCDYYISSLSAERNTVFADVHSKIRSWGAIYICISFGLIILIW